MEFAPVLFGSTQNVHSTWVLRNSCKSTMRRCIFQDMGALAVENLRPIALSSCKIKWFAGVIRLALDDLVAYVVHPEKKGSVKKWCMDGSIPPPPPVQLKAQSPLPLRPAKKVQAPALWAHLIVRHFALHFFPSNNALRHANMATRTVLGIKSWDVPSLHCQQSKGYGGSAWARPGIMPFGHIPSLCTPLVNLLGCRAITAFSCSLVLGSRVVAQAPIFCLDLSHLVSFLWHRFPREDSRRL